MTTKGRTLTRWDFEKLEVKATEPQLRQRALRALAEWESDLDDTQVVDDTIMRIFLSSRAS